MLGRPHRQLSLPLPPRARRVRRGRPPLPTSGVPHLARPALSSRHPAHVTLRVGPRAPLLRTQRCMGAIRRAFRAGRERFGFRLVHYSVQGTHLHLLVEAADKRALSRGIQGLSIRVARALNGETGRKGKLFADRYHARGLATPTEVRNVLRYVLLNGRHHARAPLAAPRLDPCSSAACFDGWSARRPLPAARDPVLGGVPVADTVAPATTWLLTAGWRLRGLIDPGDVPGSKVGGGGL